MEQSNTLLAQIQKVEVSPFVWTRIQQKIAQPMQDQLSTNWIYAIAASILVLISLNIVAIEKDTQQRHTQILKNMNLMTDNNLYHE